MGAPGMDWSDILKFIVAILWPLVTVVALVLFRRPLTRLASEIAVRTTKVSFKGVSVEFQRLTPLAPAWSVSSWSAAAQNVHTLTSSELFDSYSSTLFDQLLHSKDADYAVVDLGRGEEWLTSRLYIFSLVLGEISRLSALVFLETVAGGSSALPGGRSTRRCPISTSSSLSMVRACICGRIRCSVPSLRPRRCGPIHLTPGDIRSRRKQSLSSNATRS
jgi:hypothetical protein